MDFSFCELPVRILCTFFCWVSSLFFLLDLLCSLDINLVFLFRGEGVRHFCVIICGRQIHSFLLWVKNKSCLRSLSSSNQEYFPIAISLCFMLLLFNHSVMSNSLQPHEWQHTRLPCPSLSPRVCSDSCWWCRSTISSSVTPCPQSFPASESFPLTQLFGQSIGALASASVLPMNIQGYTPI